MREDALNNQQRKLRAVLVWCRQQANAATTAEASATYTECGDRLEAALATTILTAQCEGCGTAVSVPTLNPRKTAPDPPAGWSQCGVSRHPGPGRSPRLALWCPACRATRRDAARAAAPPENTP